MSSASLAIAHRAHPDRARIAALSAAMALNIAVIVIASRPITPTPLAAVHQLTPAALIRLIEPPPIVKPPPPIHMAPLPVVTPLTHVALPHVPVSVPVVVPTTTAPVATVPVSLPTSNISGDATVTAPVEATLAYRAAPLHYPRLAVRRHMHGTVLLRVLVDASGKPVQVIVDQGSGFALLDRSAREQVLAHWLFQPAIVNGQAVRAWANIPVTFDLRD